MIGKVIANLLTNNSSLTALVSANNIYPYVINENTQLPAIIYTIDSVESEYDKDGWAGDYITFSVSTFEDDYAILQNIVRAVRAALEWNGHNVIESTTISYIRLQGLLEGYNINENVYVNKLTFNVYVTGY